MSKQAIYRSGLVLFGLAYFWLKQQMGGWLFLATAVAYAIIFRLLAERFGRENG